LAKANDGPPITSIVQNKTLSLLAPTRDDGSENPLASDHDEAVTTDGEPGQLNLRRNFGRTFVQSGGIRELHVPCHGVYTLRRQHSWRFVCLYSTVHATPSNKAVKAPSRQNGKGQDIQLGEMNREERKGKEMRRQGPSEGDKGGRKVKRTKK
jgi:hypothetical protein